MKKSYGGVVINDKRLVLLREPANHYDGYVWTFPKGAPEEGESAEETALREVAEETGICAKIVLKLPGSFPGSTTTNEYFLMEAIGEPKKPDNETRSVRWATRNEAEHLISLSTNKVGKSRDLQVLNEAFKALDKEQNASQHSFGTIRRSTA